MTKAETLAALKNQLNNANQFCGSLYSLEQVIKIVEGIDPVANVSAEAIETAIASIVNDLENHSTNRDLVDFDSAEFSLDYDNTVRVENIDIRIDAIEAAIINGFEDLLNPSKQS